MRKLLRAAVSAALSMLCIIISIPTAGAAFADDMLSKMTLEEKIGQMITVAVRNWDGEGMTILESEAAEIIRNNSVGGVILFAENIENTQQTVKLINDLQNAAVSSRNKLPLFVSVDQEGGAVVRLRQGTSLPPVEIWLSEQLTVKKMPKKQEIFSEKSLMHSALTWILHPRWT